MKNKKIKVLIIIFCIIVIVDQFTKFLIIKFVKEPIKIIPRILEFEIVKNTGIAFGINNGNMKNILLILIFLILIISFIKRQFKLIDIKTMISLSLMFAGGVSNLIDRIVIGGVLDFIKISTFPIFNIADASIVIGWVLLVINIIKFTGIEDEKEKEIARENFNTRSKN